MRMETYFLNGLLGKGVESGEDDDVEVSDEMETSRYKDLLESTEEKMGQPIEDDLAEVCQKIWGKAIPTDRHKKKEETQKILIPVNCTAMKTPRLNISVYIKLNDGAQGKERAAQNRQKEIARASVPILQAMVELKKAEKMASKSIRQRVASGKRAKPEKEQAI